MMTSNGIKSRLTCGGIKCDITSRESFVRDTLVRYKHNGHEISGGRRRGGQGGATVPEYNIHWIFLWRVRKIEEDHIIKNVLRYQKEKIHEEIFPKLDIFKSS